MSLFSSFNSSFLQPGWLKEGVYAVYRFKCAYGSEGPLVWGDYGWELSELGEGYYRWEVLSIEGNLATLEVTFSTSKRTETTRVVINIETMDLVEDGRVWGKAWLWIDPAMFPPTQGGAVKKNITLVVSWLNETVKNPEVTPISSLSELDLPPIRTGLGSVDLVISMSAYINVTNLNLGGIIRNPISSSIISWLHDAQSGLLVSGYYIDDILTQRFGVYYFEEMEKMGEVVYWLYLEDTNVDIGAYEEQTDIFMLLRRNYSYILLGVLAVLFIIPLIKNWRGIKV
ncbi:MAG: hypothetical protein QW385_02085 [Thermoproteota archaeon]